MCSDQATCRQIREYLQSMHIRSDALTIEAAEVELQPDQRPSANYMMRKKLHNYLNWKRDFAKVSASLFAENQKVLDGAVDPRQRTNSFRGKGPPNKRRRVRGGATAISTSSTMPNGAIALSEDRTTQIETLLAELQPAEVDLEQRQDAADDPLHDLEDYFEMLDLQDLVVVHPYDGDLDEHILEELKPRYIIMYEPDSAFIRRVEVYRSSHTDRNVRVYFIYYGGSVEEQRYLSSVRREKDAFTRLIREKAVGILSQPLLCSITNDMSEHDCDTDPRQ